MATPRVHDTGITLQPDHRRVVTRLFVAGREDVGPGDSRAAPVIQRVMDLTEAAAEAIVRDLDRRFGTRHRTMHEIYHEHADLLIARLDGDMVTMSAARRLVLGAAFTHEYSIEGAALCNPSAVLFPPPSPGGSASFVMSVRGVGEGHRSSIGFRTGAIDSSGSVRLDPASNFPVITTAQPALHRRSVFHAKLDEDDDDRENASFVLDPLPERFDDSQLAEQLALLSGDTFTRRHTDDTITHLRAVAASSYRSEFAFQTAISERVLWPQSPAERHGMEDARFVLFTDDDGSMTYYGTYTAFDGVNIAQHLLQTDDFRTFFASPLAGAAAQGKGLALFPRRIDGRFAALSRSDRESNALAYSDDMHCWPTSEQIQIPTKPWELLQLGNCGSPIETEQGWLVLTHGVGPMRTYSLGVILLDLEHPERVIASSDEPIVVPGPHERDGYVPNVVYSCGGFIRGDTLVLPYGVADQHIRIATLSVAELLQSLRRH